MKKPMVDGIAFDSKLEADFYEELKAKKMTGKIGGFTLQPRFLLQPGFEKDGQKHQPIYYVADFDVFDPNGAREIVDVKSQGPGSMDQVFRIKRKMFDYHHPHLQLTVLTKNPVKWGGGWIDPMELEKLRIPERKAKKAERDRIQQAENERFEQVLNQQGI